MFLLDTDIVSDLMSDRFGPVGRKLAMLGDDDVCTSIVVAAELRFGAAKRNSKALLSDTEFMLEHFQVLPLKQPFDTTYAQLRLRLQRRGTTLDANDLMIAAHALTLGCTLVSHDAAFRLVPELQLEDWLA